MKGKGYHRTRPPSTRGVSSVKTQKVPPKEWGTSVPPLKTHERISGYYAYACVRISPDPSDINIGRKPACVPLYQFLASPTLPKPQSICRTPHLTDLSLDRMQVFATRLSKTATVPLRIPHQLMLTFSYSGPASDFGSLRRKARW